MMQFAIKSKEDIKLIVSDTTPSEAQRIINVLKGQNALIFVDNCCDDANVIKLFMQQPNIRVVGFCDDYSFESSKHLFDGIIYLRIETSEISIDDAQHIYEKIPVNLRTEDFSYKTHESEKVSMLEMISLNVKGVLSKNRIREVLNRVHDVSNEAFQSYFTCNISYL